jgi:hypothetical protein
MRRLLAFALPFAAVAFVSLPAEASSAGRGSCTNPAVLGFITSEFEIRAADYLKRDVSIYEIREMHLNRYEPQTEDLSSVEREYCHAKVSLTDGQSHALWYLVEHPWGFAGAGRGVEFCIAGLDPWRVYGAQCKSLR